MDWLSALRYGAGPTTWTATVSSRPFSEARELVGGTIEVASGIRESFTIRTNRDLEWVFRVKESELASFLLALEYGMENPETLTFYPNGVAATGYLVNVIAPAHGERYVPQRTEQMGSATTGSMFDCPVTFRKVDGTAWSLNYFAP